MSLKTFGLSVVIGGLVASSFKNSFKTANTSLAGMRNNIKGMNKTKLAISEFKLLSQDAKKNRVALEGLRLTLKKAGIDTNNLEKDTRSFRLALINLKKASRVQIKIDGLKNDFAAQKASIVGIGASLYGVTKMIGSANEVLKSQGEIKSLGITKQGIEQITKAANNMSLQFGQITAPEFIKASYDIKSGIASLSDEGVKKMTQFAATTAVATKSSTAEMTKLYALGYGIFRKDFGSDMDFGKKFSGAIAGAVQAFRTDGADLARGLSNIGASAHAMGVSLQEELAIVGLSKGSFDSASEAGSGYRAFLVGVGKAQKELGLSFTDSEGKMLPMVDVLTKIKEKYGDNIKSLEAQQELQKAFGSQEAVKTVMALIDKTDDLTKAQQNLQKAMDGGLSKSEQMASAMDMGYGFEKMGNAMSYMSYTIGKTLAPAVDVLATGLGGIAKGISWLDEKVPALLPTLSGLAMGFLGVVTVLKSATLMKLGYSLAINTVKKALFLEMGANNMAALSFNRVSIATALSTAKTKVFSLWQGITAAKTKAVAFATNLYSKALMFSGVTLGSLGAKLKAFSLFSTLATAKQWLFNVALSANPIGLVVAGIAALGAGLVWAYNKFDWFKSGVDTVWGFVKTVFEWSPMGLLMDGFGKAFDWLSSKFEWFGGAVEKMKSAASSVGSWFGGLFGSDDEDEKKDSNKPVNNPKFEPAKAMKKVAVATAMTTSLAVAQPAAVNVPSTYNNVNTAKKESKQSHVSNNTYTITVHVQSSNPKDIAQEIKKVIAQMESSRKNRSFEDEEI